MFRFGYKMCSVFLLLAVTMFFISAVYGAAEEKTGVLIVAHGSDETSWNQAVQQAAEQVNLPYPVELGFLEFTEPDIHAAIKRLEEQGVNKIIAVPLFISSYSNHIEEIKYVLGLRDSLPEVEEPGGGHGGGDGSSTEEEELVPVETQAEIVLTPALDDHVIVPGILADRLKTISQNPEQEIAVLVAHGSDTVEGQQEWCANLASVAGQLKSLLNLKHAGYGFVAMGQPAVRDVVSQAVYQGDVLVVPVMLSEGYFTGGKIPEVLGGLEYGYPEAGNRALLPHDNISKFIELRVNDVVLPPLQVEKNGEICQIEYTDVALESDGKICVCGSFVFRAMQVAFDKLWKNDILSQNEIEVVAHHPTDGTEAALKMIVGPGNFTIEGTVEDVVNVTPDNYTYRVTNIVTGQTLTVKARTEMFPEKFFDLSAKIKNQTATPEEKNEFQNLRSQVVEKLRWEPAEEFFSWELVEVPPVSGDTEEKTGVLVVAHGSDEAWNQTVQQEVEQVKLPYPVELVFLESVERDIPAVVKSMEEQGINRIIAVPLFISTYSNHIEEIKYILGLRDALPEEEELVQVETQAEIVLTPALDDHVMVAAILADRLKTISQNPEQEVAVLVGHGSSDAEGLQKWCENLSSLSIQLKELYNFKAADYGFVGVGQPTVRDVVSQAVYQGDVLVVPVMLSEGVFTGKKIPEALEGLEYRYPEAGNRALLPHTNISRFIELSVNDVVLPPLQVKKNSEICQIKYTDVALEPDGKICVCGSFVFRAMQVAFNELWNNDIPDQDKIKVVTAHPTDGAEAALKTIVGPGNFTIEGTVGDAVYATPDNYTYWVTNIVTGQTLTVKARTEMFPENFFDLRAKVKNQTATVEEKSKYQTLRSQVVEKLCWKPAEEVFAWQLVEVQSSGGGSSTAKSEQVTKTVLQGKATTINLFKNQGILKLPAEILPPDTEINVKPWIKNELSGNKILVGYEIKATSVKKEAITTGNEKYTIDLKLPAGLKQIGAYYYDPVYDAYVPVQFDYEADSGEVKASLKHFLPFIVVEEQSVKIADLQTGDWYQEVVQTAATKNLIPLSSEGNFKPGEGLTRELAARAIALAAHVPGIKDNSTFQDVRTRPFAVYIASSAKAGLINGYPNGSFKPVQTVTRSEWLALILRALGEESKSSTTSFPDLKGHWAEGIFARGHELGLVKGYPDGNMRPEQTVTRAEAASVLLQAFPL